MSSPDDAARYRAIEAYQVLDRPARPELLALAELTAACTGYAGASIDLGLDEEREPIATYGVVDRYTPGCSQPLVTPDGVVVGSLTVHGEPVRDPVGDRRQLLHTLAGRAVDALELELATRRLAAADQRLVAFAGQVSHDLKNPLSAARMSLELVREELGPDADPQLGSLLERALRGVDRMDRMIGDLHEFTRVGGAPQPVAVDLDQLLAELVADLGEAVAPGQVRAVGLPTVRGDAGQLGALLHNLVVNALKFAPWDAPVDLAAEEVPDGWRVTVSDHGPGVPLEDRARVFDPMVRLDTSVPGSGVGLATCRRIAEAHGGRIGIDDRPGGGAVVWFELPG